MLPFAPYAPGMPRWNDRTAALRFTEPPPPVTAMEKLDAVLKSRPNIPEAYGTLRHTIESQEPPTPREVPGETPVVAQIIAALLAAGAQGFNRNSTAVSDVASTVQRRRQERLSTLEANRNDAEAFRANQQKALMGLTKDELGAQQQQYGTDVDVLSVLATRELMEKAQAAADARDAALRTGLQNDQQTFLTEQEKREAALRVQLEDMGNKTALAIASMRSSGEGGEPKIQLVPTDSGIMPVDLKKVTPGQLVTDASGQQVRPRMSAEAQKLHRNVFSGRKALSTISGMLFPPKGQKGITKAELAMTRGPFQGMMNQTAQVYANASRELVDLVKRSRTGAAVNMKEEQIYKLYVPGPLDTKSSRKDKLQRLGALLSDPSEWDTGETGTDRSSELYDE